MSVQSALVVDDSKSARVTLSRMLTELGVTVSFAESAEEAFSYLNDSLSDSNKPDLIFMDHLMPGIDGLQAVKCLSQDERYAGIPVVMYTSKEESDFVDEAKASGAVGVIGKPTRLNVVERVLSDINTLMVSRAQQETGLDDSTNTPLAEHSSAEQEKSASQPAQDDAHEHIESILREQLHSRVSEAISQRLHEIVGGIQSGVKTDIEETCLRPLRERLDRFEQNQHNDERSSELKKACDHVNVLKERVRTQDAKLTDLEYFITDNAEKFVTRAVLSQELETFHHDVQKTLEQRFQTLMGSVDQCTNAFDFEKDENHRFVRKLLEAIYPVIESRVEDKLNAFLSAEAVELDAKPASMTSGFSGMMIMTVLSTFISLSAAAVVLFTVF